ncbi:MAG TPA: hypothetical protein VGG91_22035 [Myxococcaceae bacterium]|jgi:hypothetical protein
MLDAMPIWLVFPLVVAMIALSIEFGYRIARVRARKSEKERDAPIDSMVGPTLGLLAFMLAFTFGMAYSRHDTRKQFVVDEANAIRTADLRAQLLVEPQGSAIRKLLREYVDVRLNGVLHPSEFAHAVKRSEQIHAMLWLQVASLAPAATDRAAIAAALVDIINLHTKRLNAVLHNRISGAVWLALYSLAVLAMGMLGYSAGMSGRRTGVATLILALAFSSVLVLITDLDRPRQGLVEVSQGTMMDLQSKLQGSTSVKVP